MYPFHKGLPPTLVPIDLSKGKRHEHPDIELNKTYMALHSGHLLTGCFRRVHFGLTFQVYYGNNYQFDAPGYNYSRWQALWEVKDAVIYETAGRAACSAASMLHIFGDFAREMMKKEPWPKDKDYSDGWYK